MKIEDLKSGMEVYSPGKSGQYASNWPIRIVEVDIPNQRVLASLNGNPPAYYEKYFWVKWRKEPRVTVNTLMGTRFATRVEIAKMKGKKN